MKRKKIYTGHYQLIDDAGQEVAIASKTGTHLDDYPWEWYLVDGLQFAEVTKATGVAESLKECIDVVDSRIKQYGLKEG